MLKAVIGSIRTDECAGIVECTGRACTCLVVEERVICNFEEPRAEMPAVLIAFRREISLHEGILCQVVRFVFVATAEGEQKTAKRVLLTLHMGYKLIACHNL